MPLPQLRAFLRAVESGYRRNLYHNSEHAADVTQSVNVFLTTGGLAQLLTPLEILALLLAAVVHDFDHVGFSNAFLVNTDDPLALLHNDKSVLENHHIHQTFTLLRQDEFNCLVNLEKPQLKQLREIVIDLVLATDFSKHFDLMGQFKAKHTSQTGVDLEKKEDKQLLLNIALKCADVGHTAKALDTHLVWTDRITSEMFVQGDEEKRRGMPVSPFCDRLTTVIPKSQTGFIEFLVLPLYTLWVEQFDTLADCHTQLRANLAHWQAACAEYEKSQVVASQKKKHKKRRETGDARSADHKREVSSDDAAMPTNTVATSPSTSTTSTAATPALVAASGSSSLKSSGLSSNIAKLKASDKTAATASE